MGPPESMALILSEAAEGAHLEAWQIGIVAFAFVAYVLVVAFVLERWEGRLHA